MNSCIHCGISFDCYEKGILFLESNQIHQHITKEYNVLNNRLACVAYSSLDMVESELKRLNNVSGLRLGLSRTNRVERLIDIETFELRFQEKETVNFIQHGRLVSHLQPIISFNSKEVYAYESLLRAKDPTKSLSPGKLFEVASKTGLHSLLDQRAREEAIIAREGKIPSGTKSFINFLPSTIYNPDYCLQHTFKVVEKNSLDYRWWRGGN